MWSVVVSWHQQKSETRYFNILIIPARESGAACGLALLTMAWTAGRYLL